MFSFAAPGAPSHLDTLTGPTLCTAHVAATSDGVVTASTAGGTTAVGTDGG